MPKHFTNEFEDEAVRLARTSGRTRREIAEDLGVGLSTLTRWISKRRDREVDLPDKATLQDTVSELKRLRRVNEISQLHREDVAEVEGIWTIRTFSGLRRTATAISRR